MASLRPPSVSPSPSPEPGRNAHARQSMGPSARGSTLSPNSPRPGGSSNARPTSELLGSAGMFQTPEAEALDQWFENLQNYEATLEEMAAASLDVNFKEELSAIEQWFKVLSEAERTAALYSLLQHSTQVQIRFFITVLQQMARSDPMTALLSPAMGGSMQSQMEAKLASLSLKSPGLKSNLPTSPTARNFSVPNQARQSLALEPSSSNFLSPDSANNQDAAATLAQQRAKLKANNAAHRISAPVLSMAGGENRGAWGPGPGSSQLGQLVEQNAPPQEVVVNVSTRPKSTESPGQGELPMSPPVGDSWADMVSTPLIPIFQKDNRMSGRAMDSNAAGKLNEWPAAASGPGVPRMGDPKIHRRTSKPNVAPDNNNNGAAGTGGSQIYGDDGNPITQAQAGRGGASGLRGNGAWSNSNTRSPALPNANRFGANDDNGGIGMNGLGMQMGAGGFGLGMGSPGLGMGMPGIGVPGLPGTTPFNMNMLALGVTPEVQLLAAQMAASGFGQPGWMGLQQHSAGMMNNSNRRGPPSSRSLTSGLKSASSVGSRGLDSAGTKEEDVDPALLNDVPAWLRSLRLHKYTPNFEGMKWQDMVMLDEAALEAKGVAALGARRKMLKTFEVVRKKMGMEGGPPMSTTVASP